MKGERPDNLQKLNNRERLPHIIENLGSKRRCDTRNQHKTDTSGNEEKRSTDIMNSGWENFQIHSARQRYIHRKRGWWNARPVIISRGPRFLVGFSWHGIFVPILRYRFPLS
jgi:hypothetical protein